MSLAADALGVARLLAAAAFPWVLGRALAGEGSPWLPLGLVVAASATDFFDGILARRAGTPSRHGALLDNLADIAFVLAAAASGAAHGLVVPHAPAAIALAFGAYLFASARGTPGSWRPARSTLGHAAGVLNYGLAALVAGAASPLGPVVTGALRPASLLVAGVNLAAVLDRAVRRGRPPAPASRA